MKWYKNFVVVWCLFYMFLALVGRVFTAEKEIFPFFRWSLYSKTPNLINHPFVMVHKIGDSILPEPENILDMQSLHKIHRTDMNLNVIRFYGELKNWNPDKAYQGEFMDVFPERSSFVLYLRTFDLSKVDYKATETVSEIAIIENNQITMYEVSP